MTLRFVALLSVFLCALGVGQEAFAYLDPGTGSMLLQLLLGGIAGALMIVKLYWARLKDFLFRRKSKPRDRTEQ